ncbi:MAG: glutamine amidotransferase-related protein, partial [Planctomycetota bacterium]
MDAPEAQSETVVIVDFGSQYAQLIARRVRESGVFSMLARPDVTVEDLRRVNCRGLIFTGGPASVYEPEAPRVQRELLGMGVP